MFGRRKEPEHGPEDLHRAFLGAASAGSEEAFLEAVRGESARLARGACAAVFLYDPAFRELHGRSLAGPPIRFGAGQGLAGWAAQERATLCSARPDREGQYAAAIDGLAEGAPPASLLAVPMIGEEGELYGVVEVAESKAGRFTDEDAAYLEMFAAAAGALLETYRRSGSWRGLAFSLAETFGRTVDSRSTATVNHSARVRDLSLAVGRSMGLTPAELEALELAALLHDAGRLETASGEFSEAASRIHVFFTEAFMRSLRLPPRLSSAVDIAIAHHEHFDGSGYPRGLRGPDLPLAARILQVVNAYDALVFTPQEGGRVLNEPQALERLRALAGTLYDPAIVETFIARRLYAQEKRQNPRLERKTPVDVTPLLADGHEGQPVEAFALDLSSSGMLLDLPEELPAGTLLRAVIHLPGERLEAMARVVRILPGEPGRFKTGVHFLWQNAG